MYGTIARLKVLPGKGQELMDLGKKFDTAVVPGWVGEYVYQMDGDPDEYYLAVLFESKDAYLANANDPEQDSRYRELRALLAADPEWHDGQVVHVGGWRLPS